MHTDGTPRFLDPRNTSGSRYHVFWYERGCRFSGSNGRNSRTLVGEAKPSLSLIGQLHEDSNSAEDIRRSSDGKEIMGICRRVSGTPES